MRMKFHLEMISLYFSQLLFLQNSVCFVFKKITYKLIAATMPGVDICAHIDEYRPLILLLYSQCRKLTLVLLVFAIQ